MALQGTIDSFPLTDVLQLLSSSAKTGELVLEGDRGRMTLRIEDGRVVGGGPMRSKAPTASSLVFELLRFRDGAFAFDAASDPSPAFAVEPTDLEQCLGEAVARSAEWAAIEAVVPSLAHEVALAPEIAEPVTIDGATWRAVVLAGSRPTVADMSDALGVEEFDGCAAIAGLVGRGLLEVRPPAEGVITFATPHVDDHPHPGTDGPVPTIDTAGGSPGGVDGVLTSTTRLGDVPRAVEDDGAGFPEHFPIDDLLGTEEVGTDAWPVSEDERLGDGRFAAPPTFVPPTYDSTPRLAADASNLHGVETAADSSWDDLIDDALDALGAPADRRARTTVDLSVDGATVTEAPAIEELGAVAPDVDASTDEVLRQMSRLSPQAAEAIAAALGTGADPAPGAGAAEADGHDADGHDADGPESFLGSV